MARDLFTLAFVEGKGWVPPEATPEQEAERLAAYEAIVTLLSTTKDRKRRRELEVDLRKAHAACAQVCMVEVNVGSIRSIEEGARNTRVNINADGLSIPVHGYVDMTNFPVWDAVAQVRANFGRCRYRIIVRRTPDIHPLVPWNEVEAPPVEGEKVPAVRIRDLVMIAPLEVTAPVEPPLPELPPVPEAPAPAASTNGSASAAAPAPAGVTTLFPQDPQGQPVCPFCGEASRGPRPVLKHLGTGRFAHKACLEAHVESGSRQTGGDGQADATPGQAPAPAAPPAAPAAPQTTPTRGPRVAEGKPWERENSDHSLNLGSDAVLANVSMTDLAVDLLDAHLAETGEAGPPAAAAVKALAALLLMAADQTQQNVRADGHFDRGDRSHTRARGMVRIAMRYHQVPWRTAEESPAELGARRQAWVASLVDYATMLFQTAVDLDR